AHQIVSITDDTIKKLTDLSSKQVMDRIKWIFLNTNMGVKQKDFDSYDELNRVIESAMKSNY
ncbi:MAG TPA: CRISPR-associated protein Csm6, partial [Lachnospiraceae bacterium]|nr:CRISPR-associated protein Csm6 [Lachnospiraceae bacterium]